ncbi:hypothetical protein [Sphingomonas sp. Ag1]|uniref:hypothetical protein n=1 Tax=Sphingomonas sp. Ag1 TaxID=1642949 RepID=UPI000A761C95|nr:hypothetical protein [Sphingomonas sp. Ag1]
MTTTTIHDLSKDSLAYFNFSMSSFGIFQDSETQDSIEELMEAYSKAMHGALERKYYLSSLDPGCGKTESIISFLKAWKNEGYSPASGVLISFGSKDQILSFIGRLDSLKIPYSCLTSDDDINRCGNGVYNTGSSHVLITTHQMIRSRCKGTSFEHLEEFFFDDKPRALRIWDEGLVKAEPLSIKVLDLQFVASILRPPYRRFAEDLVSLAASAINGKAGDRFTVSGDMTSSARAICIAKPGYLPKEALRTLEAIAKARGISLRLGSYGGTSSLALVGACDPLPDDFAPAFILDASGRVRGTYAIWEDTCGDLVRLPSKANDYSSLTVHLWRIGSGNDALLDADRSRTIFREVAKVIEEDRYEPTLQISKMPDDRLDTFKLTKDHLSRHDDVELEFLHWGGHLATNKYNTIERVIMIGAYDYGRQARDALASAAAGCTGIAPDEKVAKSLLKSEYQHNLLQGLMRSNARNAKKGVCGKCEAYVVVPEYITPADIEKVFPGCTVKIWCDPPALSTGEQRMVDAISRLLSASSTGKIRKGLVTKEAGVDKSFISRALKKLEVREKLHSLGIEWNTRHFYRGRDGKVVALRRTDDSSSRQINLPL